MKHNWCNGEQWKMPLHAHQYRIYLWFFSEKKKKNKRIVEVHKLSERYYSVIFHLLFSLVSSSQNNTAYSSWTNYTKYARSDNRCGEVPKEKPASNRLCANRHAGMGTGVSVIGEKIVAIGIAKENRSQRLQKTLLNHAFNVNCFNGKHQLSTSYARCSFREPFTSGDIHCRAKFADIVSETVQT